MITITQVSEWLEIGRSTVWRWCETNKIKYIELNNVIHIEEYDLFDFIYLTKYQQTIERTQQEKWVTYLQDSVAEKERRLRAMPIFERPPHFTLNQVSYLLKVSPHTVDKWLVKKKLFAIKFGFSTVVETDELIRFLHKHPQYKTSLTKRGDVLFSMLPQESQLEFLADRHEIATLDKATKLMKQEVKTYQAMIRANKIKLMENRKEAARLDKKYHNIHMIFDDELPD